jgi:hypothetical protein
MKLRKGTILFIGFLIISLFLVGCSRNEVTSTPADTVTTTQAPTVVETQPLDVPTEPSTGAPADVPIMPDAFELQVPNQLNITYKVNAMIKDVVDFYTAEFPNYGWDVINNPDSVIGAMAQLSRSNANGDRLVFSIQYNPVGEFSIIQIFITRTK